MGGYSYKEIILNSEDFTYGSKNAPIFHFEQVIDDSDFFQVHRVTVPFSYYVFDSGRTSMTVNGVPYTWPQGNYTPNEWVAVMANLLPATMICSWDAVTNKISFKNTLNAPFNVTFAASEKANVELGFPTGDTAAVSFGTYYLATAPFVCNFSGPNFLYLRSNTASIFNNTEMFFSRNNIDTSNSGDILAMIPLEGNRNTVTNYVDQTNNFFQWKTIGNKRLEFYFTLGNRPERVNFNGQSFQLRLHGFSQSEDTPYRFNR